MARGKRNTIPAQTRLLIAQTAARLMAEDAVPGFTQAKQKAVERLGLDARAALPSNQEIEQALHEYRRLFQADTHPRMLEAARRQALQAMRLLSEFQPCLTGPVLRGTAGPRDPITLHAFSDSPETLGWHLQEHGIPFQLDDRTLRQTDGSEREFPLYRFLAGEHQFEVVVMPLKLRHHPPASPVDGRPMSRANAPALERLLSEAEPWPTGTP